MTEIEIRRKVKKLIKEVTTLDVYVPSEMVTIIGLMPISSLPKEEA